MGDRSFLDVGFTRAIWIGISWDIGRVSFDGKDIRYEINILIPLLIISFQYDHRSESE